MDLRLLKYFVTTANECNLTKAAEILHITQPTLSHQLKILEDELQCKLFTRASHGIELTPAGISLQSRAEDILELVKKTEYELKNAAENAPVNINIGCSESEKSKDFMALLKSFKDKYPNIHYHIYCNSTEAITKQLNNGLLDFAYIVGDFDYTNFSSFKLPYENQAGILIKKDDTLANSEHIDLDLFVSLPIIKREVGSFYSENSTTWMRNNHANTVATFTTLSSGIMMLEAGLGYVLCYDDNINLDMYPNVCFRPLHPPLQNGTYIIWKEHRDIAHLAKQLLAEIIEHYDKTNRF